MNDYKDGFILAALLGLAGLAYWWIQRNPQAPATPAGSLADDPYTQHQLDAELNRLRDEAAARGVAYAGQGGASPSGQDEVLTIDITRDASSYGDNTYWM